MNAVRPKSADTIKVELPVKTVGRQFSIAGIGASAGGLEALEQFFSNMPMNCGLAFVVIQHLDPTHAGIMPELLQRITPMKVCEATDRLKVKPNCVYVIPPNKSISLLNGTLHLFDPVESRGLRLPIDIFFRSLANDNEEKSIGIILSGMGSDGSIGVKAIKEKNGLVLVQEPSSAKFDSMPRSAIEAVNADIVAPAEELPEKLISLFRNVPVVKTDPELDSKIKSNLDKIIILIRDQIGHDFTLYKKTTLFRRIDRRKSVHQIDKISNYVRFCQENPLEVEILFKELLIGVTSFFRDPAVWKKLRESVLPQLMEELPEGHVLRAWVTGCSTGEEAYSLAIVFKELLGITKKRKHISLQIFATDIDMDAIDKARKGLFASTIAADVSPEWLTRYFSVEGEYFRINNTIREMVVFAHHNSIKDPPFTKLDIISCRNVLIYMEPELQKKLITLFNYSLNPGGILLLGNAETLGSNYEGMEELDSKLRIFKSKLTNVAPELIYFPSSLYNTKTVTTEKKIPAKTVENIQILADQILIQRFAPASVLVNAKGDILYITGRIEKYLELVAGKANWNIHAMAREGLRFELPGAFRKAMQNFDPVVLHDIKILHNGSNQCVDVVVQRIENPDSIRGMIIIVFKDQPAVIKPVALNPASRKTNLSKRYLEMEMKLQRMNEELQNTREQMQTSQEELKSTNEELQSTNEELQSTNEELQSANEELTTSKEEMQSMNEELQTVNIELQSKVIDFAQSGDDMKNLLNATEIATLFLDKDLNIRRFTNSITNIIKLRNTDIGRPFTDLVTNLNYPEIDTHARQVLKTLSFVESIISTHDQKWFTVRIMPYRTLEDRIDGLVITFIDITTTKLAEETSIASEIRYRKLFDAAKEGILILNAETGKIEDVNPFLMSLLGYTKEQFIEKAIWEIGSFNDLVANQKKFSELQEKEMVRYENLPLETSDGRKINVEFISNIYSVNHGKVVQCFIRESNNRLQQI
jgi:two-component system CheB/CheR fusion protein